MDLATVKCILRMITSRLILLLVIFMPTVDAAAQSGWQKEWEATLAAAEKEAEVSIAGPPGDAFREAIVTGFGKLYPKIKVELLGGSGGDKVARILRERQAGVYGWIFMSPARHPDYRHSNRLEL